MSDKISIELNDVEEIYYNYILMQLEMNQVSIDMNEAINAINNFYLEGSFRNEVLNVEVGEEGNTFNQLQRFSSKLNDLATCISITESIVKSTLKNFTELDQMYVKIFLLLREKEDEKI